MYEKSSLFVVLSDSDSEGDTAGSSPPDFSNALCEGVIHDHLSSTLLSASFNGPGSQVRKRARKVRILRVSICGDEKCVKEETDVFVGVF